MIIYKKAGMTVMQTQDVLVQVKVPQQVVVYVIVLILALTGVVL